MSMKRHKLGSQGAIVSRMGLGCMGMSEAYGERNDEESPRRSCEPWTWESTFWTPRTPMALAIMKN